jgi:hypothetical protein
MVCCSVNPVEACFRPAFGMDLKTLRFVSRCKLTVLGSLSGKDKIRPSIADPDLTTIWYTSIDVHPNRVGSAAVYVPDMI